MSQLPSDAITCIKPSWQVHSRVRAFTSTRNGGVSEPPFDSMNLGLHVADQPQHVLENRRRLCHMHALPGEPLWLNQTHSSRIVSVGSQAPLKVDADGAYTAATNTVLCALTADCLPVVISDSEGTEVAVVHAGWRGLANGVLKNALACFSDNKALHAWLGPAIGPDRFEVGEDVRDAFCEGKKENLEHFKPTGVKGKYLADLYALAESELRRCGCEYVSGGDYCTHTQSELFHSHRRDGVRSGRIATIVWIEP